ncbi:helix-turn-helix domain-containing protein [Pseudalkalibacillus sp. Hm43]|uniref:helix-turn-helix domain-containing protein n=1 Tax=Pseudalkalibacillus sp. Hm43 TaxID=3450742 RepID=UPI003F4318BE
MDYAEMIYLFGIHRMNGERTTSGLFHLLTGKKSSQTVQDGKLFGLSHLFGTFQGYKYAAFASKIHEFEKKGWIHLEENQKAILTELGEWTLQDKLENKPIPDALDGWRFGDIARVFWRRFSLFTQTLSYLLVDDSKFHPIQNDPQVLAWVKHHFPKAPQDRIRVSEVIHKELKSLLHGFDRKTSENLVFRLTRYNRVGRTSTQMSEHLKMDPMECHIHFQAALHRLVRIVMEGRSQFPSLYLFISDLDSEYTLTESTRKTYELIQAGYPHEKLPMIRNLKMSTIEDHIVELAIHVEDFQIEPYISNTDQIKIMESSNRLNSKKLKDIKQDLDEDFTYFQIRLTLSKHTAETSLNKGAMSLVD